MLLLYCFINIWREIQQSNLIFFIFWQKTFLEKNPKLVIGILKFSFFAKNRKIKFNGWISLQILKKYHKSNIYACSHNSSFDMNMKKSQNSNSLTNLSLLPQGWKIFLDISSNSSGDHFIEGLYVGNMNWAFFFH